MTQLGVFFCKCRISAYRITTRTLCVVYSIFDTSSSFEYLIRKQCIIMTQSFYYVCFIGVTAFTGICSITIRGTGRCCYNTGVLMLMSVCGNYDILGYIADVDINYLTAKFGIVCYSNAIIGNVYAIIENFYLHNKALIVKLEACIEVLALYNGTCSTFHSGYADHTFVGNIHIIIRVQLAILANCRFKRVCKNFHTLEIGM